MGNYIIHLTPDLVYDKSTGREWYAGPDNNTDWNEAKRWVEGLQVGGGRWSMPTLNELKGLYKKGAGSRNMTPLLKTTGWWVWSGEITGTSKAYNFYFGQGGIVSITSLFNRHGRAFAVRSRSDDG